MKSEAGTDTGGIRHKLEAEMIGNWGYITLIIFLSRTSYYISSQLLQIMKYCRQQKATLIP